MRYSSHLYLRTDGSLGRYPIIELDSEGKIVSICECGETLHEMASTRFFAGVIIPKVNPFTFSSKEDFINQCQFQLRSSQTTLSVGNKVQLMLVCSFDINKFDGVGAKFVSL